MPLLLSTRSCLLTIVLTIALSLTGCALLTEQSQTKNNTPLIGTYWTLVSLRGNNVQVTDHEAPHLILGTDNQVKGYSGCNRFQGQYEQNGEIIRFHTLAMTRRACLDQSHIEHTLMQLLHEEVKWSIEGHALQLHHTAQEMSGVFQMGDINQ